VRDDGGGRASCGVGAASAVRSTDVGPTVSAGWLSELGEFLRIASISADPARRDDVRRAGEWVRDFILRSGGDAELVDCGGRPLVVGELRASGGRAAAPTVLCYGHFDVQPAEPVELWESPPFEPTVRDGWLYARGAVDTRASCTCC